MSLRILALVFFFSLLTLSGCGSKKLSESEKQEAQRHYRKGVKYALSAQYQKDILFKAVREFQRCLDINPNHLWARLGLSTVQVKLGDFTKAREGLKRIVESDALENDMLYPANYYLGVVNLRLKDYKAAILPLKKAIDYAPSEPKLLYAKWNLRVAYYALYHRYPTDLEEKYRLHLPTPSFASPVRFTDVSQRAGVDAVNLGRGSAWGDFDRDGDLDLFTVAERDSPHLYRNNGDGSFTDVTVQAGLVDPRGGWGSLFADYDNDGDLDIYITRDGWRGNAPNTLYQNNGDGTFTDVTEQAGVADSSDSFCAAFGDYDNDGYLDLYVGNGVSTDGARNTLYHNNGNGTFSDVTLQAGVGGNGRSIGITFGDYDNDGDLDLYVVNFNGINALYRNNGDGTFTDVAKEAGVSRAQNGPNTGFVAFFFDYNNDAWLDLFVCGWTSKMAEVIKSMMTGMPSPSGKRSALYRNNGDGTFTDVTVEAGLARTVGAMAATFGDVDNDGYYDIYLACGGPAMDRFEPDLLYHNNGDGTFTDITQQAGLGNLGKGHGTTMADYDGDGDLDIYSPQGGMGNNPGDQQPNSLYRNDGTPNHWLIVELVGKKSNRDGIGAKVTLTVQSQLRYAEVNGGCGFGVTNSLPLEFGLGQATQVNQLKIVWPSGIVQIFKNLPVDRVMKIIEGEP